MRKNLTLIYALTQCTFWIGFAAISAFAGLYLLNIGVSNSIIGIVVGVGAFVSAILQPIFGTLSDRNPKFSARRILIGILALIAICEVLLLILRDHHVLLSCIFYSMCIMALQLMSPFVNSIAMLCINDGHTLNYSSARALGSVGYACAAFFLGNAADARGVFIIPVFILIAFGLLGLTLLFYPKQQIHSVISVSNKTKSSSDGKFFFAKYPKYGILFIGLIMAYFSHVLINSYNLQIIQTKGGGSAQMGTATFIAAMIELVMMLAFSKIQEYVSLRTLLRISSIFFALKTLGSLLVTSVTGYYMVQFLQLFAWGIMAVALVYYVNKIMAPEDVVKGQAYATMSYTIGSITASAIGGILIDIAGINVMLIVGTCVAAVGALITFIGTKQ